MSFREDWLRLAPSTSAFLSFLGLAAAAHAQEQTTAPSTEAPTEIVITGSHIARPELDRLQPTTVLDSKMFEQRGYTDVGAALEELPGFGIQPASSANIQSSTGVGQSFVDLYSLGSQRTLVLVNGRRFVSSNSPAFGGIAAPGTQVDLNVVPTKLIERIETISVGGAPIYGSDAIAGTVNIILKKDFDGLDVDAGAGESDAKDAAGYRMRVLAGKNFFDDRGNITSVFEFSHGNGLPGTARKSYASDLGFEPPATSGPFQNVLVGPGAVSSLSTSGVPVVDDFFFLPGATQRLAVTNAVGQPLAFSPGSSALTPYDLGAPTGNPIFWTGGDGIRLSQFSNLLDETEKMNGDVLANFKVADHLNLFAEGWFSETHNTNLVTQPAYNTTLFGPAGTTNGAFKISINNPFLSSGDRALIQSALNAYGLATLPTSDPLCQTSHPARNCRFDSDWSNQFFYVQRASVDLQSGFIDGDQVVSRGVLGMKGDFGVSDHKFDWEVALNYGYSRNRSLQPAYVFQNLANALNPVVGPGGQIVCAGTPVAAAISTGSSTCAPLNIFGAGSPSAAAIAYITHDALQATVNTQRDATANFSGDVLKLPGGEWKAAVGFENRRESQKYAPDQFFTGNAADGNQPYGQLTGTAVEGSYVTNEAYAETLIPLFSPSFQLPLLHQLELEGALRHVKNSIAGSANTWTAGLRWSPIQDIQFRGNRTVSIRAPAVTELFLPSATSFEFAADPCDHTQVNLGTAPATRKANCQAAGIDTATFASNVINATAQGITSGNAGLQPETAKSKTFGVVLRPRWVPGLTATVDYIEIDIVNAIEQLNLTEILDACYDSTSYPNNQYCSQFSRSAAGQITAYHDGYVNAGLRDFEGISSSMEYAFNLPADLGRLAVRVNYLDTTKLTEKVGSASVNDLRGELASALAEPKGKGSLSFDYTKGPVDVYWQGLYVSSMVFSNTNLPDTLNIPGVGAWWLFNSTLTYRVTDSFTTRFIVNNVFDKEPPFPALAGVQGNFSSATSLYFSGIIGRTYFLQGEFAF
jgi:outer membrane receptor protein involved in Fe transport